MKQDRKKVLLHLVLKGKIFGKRWKKCVENRGAHALQKVGVKIFSHFSRSEAKFFVFAFKK
jgi:hypothetical protein